MRRLVFLILSVAISLVVLYFVLRDVPLQAIGEAIQKADVFWVLATLLAVILAVFLRAIRWRALLGNRLSIREATLVMSATFLLNQLPFRLGEIARSLLVRRNNIPIVSAAASIVIERMLDVLTVVLMIAWAINQIPDINPEIGVGAMFFGAFALLGFLVLLVLAHFPQIIEKMPIVARFAPHLLDALQPLRDWRILGAAVFWTVIGWAVSLLSLYTSMMALDLPPSASFLSLAMGLATLSIAIPTTLAGIGLIEGAIQLSGGIAGLDTILTTALGFLFHGMTILAYMLMGIPSVWLLGLSLGDLLKPKAETSGQEERFPLQ